MTMPTGGFTTVPIPTTPPSVPVLPNAAPAAPVQPPVSTVQPDAFSFPATFAHNLATPTAPTVAPQPSVAPPQPVVAPPTVPSEAAATALAASPDLPNELRGKTPQQIIQIYSALRDSYIESQASQPAPPASAPQPAPSGGEQSFWADPDARIKALEQTVIRAVAPLLQDRTANRAMEARDIAAAALPNFAEMLPHMTPFLDQLPPAALQDPTVWRRAYILAEGERRLTQQPTVAPPQANLPPSVPWNNGFFVEGPTAPSPAQTGMKPLTAAELHVAAQMGMTSDVYQAWKGGAAT